MKTKKLFVLYTTKRHYSNLYAIFTRRKTPTIQIGTLIEEPKYSNFGGAQLTKIANLVAIIIRTKSRWERTLIADFPNVNFGDPRFFGKFLRAEPNVVFSMRFFLWVSDKFEFKADERCCSLFFDRLVKAKACRLAQWFMKKTGFEPKGKALEAYVRCLCELGFIEEAVQVFERMRREEGVCFGVKTWNLGLNGCLKSGRTDLLWKLYGLMMESDGVVAGAVGIDVETIGYLIQGYVQDKKATSGYKLLREVFRDGLVPESDAFNSLISAFGKTGMYDRVSELFHMMIESGRVPDANTYQVVIYGLCKRKNITEAKRIFNDLKARGYAPNIVMYNTMIGGFGKIGFLGDARKLWFELIDKGMLPNTITYSTLIAGYCKKGEIKEAKRLFEDMGDRGVSASTVTYTTMISGLCSVGRIDEACELFENMPRKGVARDVMTYNVLINAHCKMLRRDESIKLFNELLACGFQPTAYSYYSLIKMLYKEGDVLEANRLCRDMQNRDLTPSVRICAHIILILCKQGYAEEAMWWFVRTPRIKYLQHETFNSLIQILSQFDKLGDCLFVLELMLKADYLPREETLSILVKKLCKENSSSFIKCLEDILLAK